MQSWQAGHNGTPPCALRPLAAGVNRHLECLKEYNMGDLALYNVKNAKKLNVTR